MDIRKCEMCGKSFDFDVEGLGCPEAVVCSAACGKKSAASRGHDCMIYDKEGLVVETNVEGVIVLPPKLPKP